MSTSDVKDCYAVFIWALSSIVMSCDLKKSSTDVIKTHEKLYRSCIIIFLSAEVAGGGGVNYSNTEHLWEVRIRVTTGFLVTHQVERVQRGMSSWWECWERTELITEKSCVRSAAGVVRSAPVQDMRGGRGRGRLLIRTKRLTWRWCGVWWCAHTVRPCSANNNYRSSCIQEEQGEQEEQDAINN